MREIKFRCWDINNNCWVFDGEPMDLHRSGRANTFLFDNDAIDVPKNAQWVQFTGLKDKNGTEIYEGDIVEYNDLSRGIMGDYEDGEYKEVNYQDGIPHLGGIDFSLWYEGDNYRMTLPDHVEIVGNIYENKDLLK